MENESADGLRQVLQQVDDRLSRGRREEAVALLNSALSEHPEAAQLYVRLGTLLTSSDRTEEAVSLLETGRGLDPEAFDAFDALGTYLQRLGRFEEAARAFRDAMDRTPTRPAGYYGFVRSKRIESGDLAIVDKFERCLKDQPWSAIEREMSHYGLGKAHEDLGNYEAAMGHYDEANRLAHQRRVGQGKHFDPRSYRQATDFFIRHYDSSFMERHRGIGLETELPLLIVGMMRSGTTLLEQIISSHSKVAAGGELTFWQEPAARHFAQSAAGGSLDRDQAEYLALEYRRRLRAIGPRMLRVTDKNPFNYFSLGPIHLLFPNARIVHCRRDPLDNCLSIYTTPVGESGLEFLHVKEDIMFAYGEYRRLVDHWRSVIPEDRLIEVDYEGVVERPETVIPQLFASIGSEWEEACLHPEQNERVVQTPSRWQVRQPITTNAVERWRRFEPWLGAFTQLRD